MCKLNQMLLLIYLHQVSQMLLAVENGELNKWKGKRLKDIEVEGD